jgi:hypothetical protein
MGTEMVIDGEQRSYPDDTKISELKTSLGFPEDDLVVYTKDGENMHGITDDQTVAKIPNGARVTSQPNQRNIYGHSTTKIRR